MSALSAFAKSFAGTLNEWASEIDEEACRDIA
jgi:hypothetical protein